jgi:type I restriction enzyme S subunit
MSYKRIGDFIQQISHKNEDGKVEKLLGVNLDKVFITSVANLNGVDMTKYKIIKKGQFGCKLMSVGRDKRLPISRLRDYDKAIISSAYFVFEVTNKNELLPEYLMMWFLRPESDRFLWFLSGGDVRGRITWEDLCSLPIKIPSIEKQQQIVAEYNTVTNRINLNNQLKQKLEATAQALYKHWFVDFEFPNTDGKPYKSSGGEMLYNEELEKDIPVGWNVERLGDISNLKYGKMLNSELFLSEGYPVFSGYGIRGYYSEYMYKERQILVLCRGVSGTGRVELSPPKSYITNLSIVVQPNKGITKKLFLYFYLKNDNLRELDSGSAQSQITTGDLGFRNILIPNVDLQNNFEINTNTLLQNISTLNLEQKILREIQSLLLAKMTQQVPKLQAV